MATSDQNGSATTTGNGTILVGSNGKDRADLAVKRALAAGAALGRPVLVQSVLDHEAPEAAEAEAVKHFEEIVPEVASADHAVSAAAIRMPEYFDDEEHGRARCLLDAADQASADLIVLGVHQGDKPLAGTMTEQLLREGGCPTLIAVNEYLTPYKKVVVAIDFSAYSDVALDTVSWLAPEAEIHLVHAYDSVMRHLQSDEKVQADVAEKSTRIEKMINDQMAGLAQRHGADASRYTVHVDTGSPNDVLERKIKNLQPDLFVIGTHGRTGLIRAMLGSVAMPFIDNPPCDIVAIKAW